MDERIECTMSVDESGQEIVITGLMEDNFKLNYTADIDFTNLVSKLTEKIDTLQQINISIDTEPTDEKITLITDTIKEIIVAYNESIILKESEE